MSDSNVTVRERKSANFSTSKSEVTSEINVESGKSYLNIPTATVNPQKNFSPGPLFTNDSRSCNQTYQSLNHYANIPLHSHSSIERPENRHLRYDINKYHFSNVSQAQYSPPYRTPPRISPRLHYDYNIDRDAYHYQKKVIPQARHYTGINYSKPFLLPEKENISHISGKCYSALSHNYAVDDHALPSTVNPSLCLFNKVGDVYSEDLYSSSDKDAIIQEKDRVLSKQQLYIIQLEDEIKDLHNNINLSREPKSLNIQMLEARQEIDVLNAQLSKMSSKTNEIKCLKMKLGETEYDHEKLKDKVKELTITNDKKLDDLKNEIRDKDLELVEMKQKYSSLEEKYKHQKEKLSTLKHYISNLPTHEEHKNTNFEISCLNRENNQLKTKLQDLEKELSENQKLLEIKIKLIETKEEKIEELELAVVSLRKQLEVVQPKTSFDTQNNGGVNEDAFNQIEMKYEQLKQKFKCIEEKHQTELKEVHDMYCLESDEAAVRAYDLQAKEERLDHLKKAYDELSQQNQCLLESNLMLKEQVNRYEKHNSLDQLKTINILVKEMHLCFREFESLIQICLQHAEGKEPNISALFGLTSSMESLNEVDLCITPDEKLVKIQDLKKDIEKLRTIISNRYAEDLGDSINCTTN